MRRTIKDILIDRDDMTEIEADNLIREAKKQFEIYIEAGDTMSIAYICEEFFGLEPDYLDEFM